MPSLAGRRVLVVEDETLVALMVEDMLTDLGCVVFASVTTVADGRRHAEAGGFDCAVLDVNLVGERVFPVAEALRTNGIPFVFATGYGAHGVREDFANTPVLTKPYRGVDLERALLSVLG